MSVLEHLQQFSEDHQKDHDLGIKPTFTAHFCELCYLPAPYHKLPSNFQNFWYWISTYCFAETYTRYTTTTFNLFIHLFKEEPTSEKIVSNRITDFTYRLVGSIKYTQLLPIKLLVYYVINLTTRTKYFEEVISEEDFRGLQLTINLSLTDPTLQQAFQSHFQQYFLLDNKLKPKMNADALKELLNTVLGQDGLDIKRLLNKDAPPKEVSLVKVEPFRGTEKEDPYEWMEAFESAANANN